MTEMIEIPPNEAGARIYAVMSAVAERLYKTAKAKTEDYLRTEMPRAKIVKERHDKGKFYATVREPHRKSRTLVYDYKERTVALTEQS